MIAGCLLLQPGCGGGPDPDRMAADATSTNMLRLAKMYSMYGAANNLQGPAEKNQLVDFIKKQPANRMANMGIDLEDLGKLFNSERDGQAFEIRWGIKMPFSGQVPVIFETAGVDGKFEVGFTGGQVREVGKAERDQLLTQEAPVQTGPPKQGERPDRR